jgi:phosphoglycolate phosphatase
VIRNIILDWSGTLVDDLLPVVEASNYVFRLAGVPELTPEQFRAEFCLPFKDFYDRYAPHVPLRQLEEWFHSEYRRLADQVVELPHARELLLYCQQRGLRTFVLSSVHREHFAAQTALTGFSPFFERAYIEVWDKRAKIGELLRDHGLEARQTMFVGDMEHDIETARQGGVLACAVLTGYHSRSQLQSCQPHLIVEHLGQLRQMLEEHDLDLEGRLLTPC